jgi:hypothetical protein
VDETGLALLRAWAQRPAATRIVTVTTLTGGAPGRWAAPGTGVAAVLGEGPVIRLDADALSTLPTFVEVEAHRPSGEAAPFPAGLAATCTTALLRTQVGQPLMLVVWDLAGELGAAPSRTLRQARDVSRMLRGAAVGWHEDRREPGEPRLAPGADWHELLATTAALGSLDRADGDVRRDLADDLMTPHSRRNRDAFRGTRFPASPNRHPGTMYALQPRSSLLLGQAPDLAAVATLTTAQCVASLARLRELRSDAFRRLDELRTDQREAAGRSARRRAQRLSAMAEHLGHLELDLSFAVEAYLPSRLVAPSQPLQDLLDELVDLFALERGAQVVGTMLDRMSAAVAAERLRIETLEAEARAARRTVWQAVAALAVPLGVLFGYLGTNIDGPQRDAGLLAGDNLRAASIIFGGTVVVLLVIAALTYGGRRLRADRRADAARRTPG